MIRATISGDVVASTALSVQGREVLEKGFGVLIKSLHKNYHVYSRVIKGDYLECYLPDPSEALRLMLIIKCFIKALAIDARLDVKPFKTHGIRLAMGVGAISRFDEKRGIIDGEAIYLSGRLISRQGEVSGKRKVIKSTLFIDAFDKKLVEEFEPVVALLDVLLTRCTARQCEVVFLKLLGKNEEAISKELNISQSAVNQHSTSAGWNAIEKAVVRFSQVIKKL